MRDLFLNRAKEGCRLSRTIGEERPEIYRIEAGSDLSLYPRGGDNLPPVTMRRKTKVSF